MTPAVAVALATLFGLSGHAGFVVLLLAVAFVQLLIIPAWGGLVRAPGAVSTLVVAGLAAAAADTVLYVSHTRGDAAEDGLGPLAGVLGLAVVGAFAVQLQRRHGRPQLVASLTRSVSAAVVAVLVASWLVVPDTRAGTVAISAGAIGCAAAGLAFAAPMPGWAQAGIGAGLSALGGLLVGRTDAAAEIGEPGQVVLVTVLVGLVALVGAAAGARADRPPLTRLALPSALVPMVLAGPVLYVSAQVVLG